VEGMWRMLQCEEADDFVLSTGETHSVREFVERAFAATGMTIAWRGEGVDEVGVDAAAPERVLVRIDPEYFRPTEVDLLLGDSTKARDKLGWTATTTFEALVKEMVAADLALVRAGDHVS
jgi:GDPmannose 4,6-dehydratase